MLPPGALNTGGTRTSLPTGVIVGNAPFGSRMACSPRPVATVPFEPFATNACHTHRSAHSAPLAQTTRIDIGSATCIPAMATVAAPPPNVIPLDNGYFPGSVALSTTQNLNRIPMGTQTMSMPTCMMATTMPLPSGPLHSKQLGICRVQTGQTQQPGVLMQPVNGGQVITGVGVQIVNVNQNPTGPIMVLDD